MNLMYSSSFVFLFLLVLGCMVSASTDAAFIMSPHSMVKVSSPTSLNLLGRFRKKEKLKIPSTIAIGSPLPEVDVEMLTVLADDGEGGGVTTIPITIQEVLGTGKSILVGMPGAFTPVCTSEHLPGFIAASSKLNQLGVQTIAVVTTNDKFVNEEWARNVGLISESSGSTSAASPKPSITILADGDANLVKALGLAEDMGFGVGVRAKRFALVCEDGLVTNVLTDDEGMDRCDMTSAANLVKILTPPELELAQGQEMDQTTLTAMVGAGLVALVIFTMMAMGGGDDHTATTSTAAVVLPAAKSATAVVKTGSAASQFTLLKQFGN